MVKANLFNLVCVTIMCRNDELSWLFTNRLSAKVLFTDRCRWQNFRPSPLRLVNNKTAYEFFKLIYSIL